MINRIYGAYKRRRAINGTVRELSRLSDRELHDIGISRGEIQNVASRTFV